MKSKVLLILAVVLASVIYGANANACGLFRGLFGGGRCRTTHFEYNNYATTPSSYGCDTDCDVPAPCGSVETTCEVTENVPPAPPCAPVADVPPCANTGYPTCTGETCYSNTVAAPAPVSRSGCPGGACRRIRAGWF